MAAGCVSSEGGKETSGPAVYTYAASDSSTVSETGYKDSASYEGTYSGILPCTSCDGIETSITLYPDHSFLMKEIYKNDTPDSFLNKGKYDVKDNRLYIKLDGAGVERPVMYKISPNALTQLDMDGNEIKGEFANHYILMKK